MAEKICVRLVKLACPPVGGVHPFEMLDPSAKKYSVAPLDIVFRTVHGFCAGLSVWQ
jgi:hypothetical protein